MKFTIPLALCLILIGVAAIYFYQPVTPVSELTAQEITSYEECVAAGYPSMESYPPQCRTADGKQFTQVIESDDADNVLSEDDMAEPVEDNDTSRRNSSDSRVPGHIAVVQAQAAEDGGVELDQVTIIDSEATDWPNSCLGLAEVDEMCAQMITSGYAVTVEVAGEIFVYRTNADGTVVRME